jgi:hypothetical protein
MHATDRVVDDGRMPFLKRGRGARAMPRRPATGDDRYPLAKSVRKLVLPSRVVETGL